MDKTNEELNHVAIIPSESDEYEAVARPERDITRKHSPLRTLTRILVGGLLTGIDGFSNHLESWEIRAETQTDGEIMQGGSALVDQVPYDIPTSDLNMDHIQRSSSIHQPDTESENSEDVLRYALIGMVFETQDRIGKMVQTGDRATRAVGHLLSPFIQPLSDSRIISPLRNRFNRLVERGETEVYQWIETGRREEVYSRKIADIALYETVDYWIDYFAENPEVVDLVSTQSVSFAEEVIEEVRERTVSADNLLESFYRTTFRRPSRDELPPPHPQARSEILFPRRRSKEQ